MRIAVLGWGSLVWDAGDLHIVNGEWHKGGPELPIELSRLSKKRGYLTYVIDERHLRRVPTRYAISRYKELDDAVADLACREGCAAHSIGYVETGEHGRHRSRTQLCWDIQEWAQGKDIDAVIWTDLSTTFEEFSVVIAAAFFEELPEKLTRDKVEEAKKYAREAPDEVDTDVRRHLSKKKLLSPSEPTDS